MSWPADVLTAAGAFVATNLDDLAVVTALCAIARSRGGLTVRQVVIGQYLAMALLVAISLASATGLAALPDWAVGLLGLVPLAMGLHGLWRLRDAEDDEPPVRVGGVAGVTALTLANGADNIAIYSLLFRDRAGSSVVVILVTFAVLVGVLVGVAVLLGTRRAVVSLVDRVGGVLVPAIFVVVGVWVLVDAGTIGHLLGTR